MLREGRPRLDPGWAPVAEDMRQTTNLEPLRFRRNGTCSRGVVDIGNVADEYVEIDPAGGRLEFLGLGEVTKCHLEITFAYSGIDA